MLTAMRTFFVSLRHGRWGGPALLVAVALGLRLGALALGPAHDLRRAMQGDSPRYLELADNLARIGSFALREDESGPMHGPAAKLRAARGELEVRNAQGLRPEVLRTPGYPAFLGAVAWLGLPMMAALIVQCVLSAAAVVGVYALGIIVLPDRRAALLAAMVVAVHPADILAANTLLTESLFTTMLLGATWLALQGSARMPVSAGAGLVVGLAALVRPVGMLLGPVIGLWMWLRDPRARTAGAAALLTATSLLPLGLWAGRNAQLGTGWRISTLDSIQNYTKTVAYMRMAGAGMHDYPRDWVNTLTPLYGELGRKVCPGETVLHAMDRLTLAEIGGHPLLYGRVLGASAIKFMTDHSAGLFAQMMGWPYRSTGLRDALLGGGHKGVPVPIGPAVAASIYFVFNLALAVGMVAGLVSLMRQGYRSQALGLAAMVGYFVLATQAVGLERMRVPVLGFQALAVAGGLMLPRRNAQPVGSLTTAVPQVPPAAAA
jgi:hypothetical protein